MERYILLLHLFGAIGMGYYLLFPFLVNVRLAGAQAAGYVNGLRKANRIGQFLLILQLLTGGYMIEVWDYSTLWMSLSVVLLVLIGAFTGMLSGPLKRIEQRLASGDSVGGEVRKARLFALLVGISFLLIVVLMKFPDAL